MPIKSELGNTEKPMTEAQWRKVKYPCIGIATCGEAVLFREFQCGTTIRSSNNPRNSNKVGTYSTDWAMEFFKPAPSTKQFILSNI